MASEKDDFANFLQNKQKSTRCSIIEYCIAYFTKKCLLAKFFLIIDQRVAYSARNFAKSFFSDVILVSTRIPELYRIIHQFTVRDQSLKSEAQSKCIQYKSANWSKNERKKIVYLGTSNKQMNCCCWSHLLQICCLRMMHYTNNFIRIYEYNIRMQYTNAE